MTAKNWPLDYHWCEEVWFQGIRGAKAGLEWVRDRMREEVEQNA